jgi:hypothetical protein
MQSATTKYFSAIFNKEASNMRDVAGQSEQIPTQSRGRRSRTARLQMLHAAKSRQNWGSNAICGTLRRSVLRRNRTSIAYI